MDQVWPTGNTLAKSQMLGGVRASVPRSTIITQGWQAITESCGRYRVYNFSKPVTHKQKHGNRGISAQNVKNVLKFTPITFFLAPFSHCVNSQTCLNIRDTGVLLTVFKISARPRTLTCKIWVGPASFPSSSCINFGKIVLWSSKFQTLFWRLC